jgi:hypothetical protein
MMPPNPPAPLPDPAAVEARIRDAFAGVTRDGGITWRQSVVRDNFGDQKAQAEAAALDRDARWEDLVENVDWRDDIGVGGFNFLDAVGCRYYIAPAMIRSLRRGNDGEIGSLLYWLGPWSKGAMNAKRIMTAEQIGAVAAFIEYFTTIDEAASGPGEPSVLRDQLSAWKK